MVERPKIFLAEWRQYNNLTQAKAAELAGMSTANLSVLETGKSNYTRKTLEALARVYQCRPADLLLYDPLNDPYGRQVSWEMHTKSMEAGEK